MTGPADRKFRAMGTDCHIVVTGPNAGRLADLGIRRVDDLEQLWSRFLPDSEVSQINTSCGRPTAISRPTFELIEKAVLAWRLSGGRFDPTMHRQINELGYDRSFSDLTPTGNAIPYEGQPSAGCDEIVLDATALTVRFPDGVGFDPGGIGKGLAADMISAELVAAGAHGVLVSLGGDLRVRGTAPTSDGWVVSIRGPRSTHDSLASVVLHDAALATSTTLNRTWTNANGPQHHLLDPETGLPSAGDVVSATAIAGEGWWAEAAAKTALLTAVTSQSSSSQSHGSQTPIPNVATLQLLEDDSQLRLGDFESYEA